MLEGLAGYGVIALFWLVGCIVFGNDTQSMPQRVMFARGVFLAPIWPVVLIMFTARWVRNRWDQADWKNL
jgi:hypothetical protein